MVEEHKFNGFSYRMDDEKLGVEKFEVIHDKVKPENIYKFHGLSRHSVDALVNGYLYASHPIELNDTMDSSNFLLGSSKPLKFDVYKKFLGPIFNSEKELVSFYENDSKSNDGFFAKGYISQMWQVLTNIFGVISLTAQDQNNLMWPHYTQEKGFQIKFKTTEIEASVNKNLDSGDCFGLFPINYSEKLNPIDISDFRSLHIPFLYLTNIKSIPWCYEEEWRFIVSKEQMGVPYSKSGLDPRPDYQVKKENRYIHYDSSIVNEITLGSNFFNGREYKIDRTLNSGFTVEPIDSDKNWNYNHHVLLLKFICENYHDRLFYSGKTFEINKDGEPYLRRTKERFEIEAVYESKYLITRTHEFY